MAFDQTKAFETKQGVLIEDGAGVFSGPDSPMGSDAPIGSLYLRTNNELWTKQSVGVNGWNLSFTAGGITNYNLIASASFTTGSTSYVLITGFSITPIAGTYAIWYGGQSTLTTTPKYHKWAIFKNGSIISDSVRSQDTAHSNQTMNDSTQTIATFNGSQTCDVRVLTQNGSLAILQRSLILIRLGG
jgi:hypothetical protein